jgi:hypothetical protein
MVIDSVNQVLPMNKEVRRDVPKKDQNQWPAFKLKEMVKRAKTNHVVNSQKKLGWRE